MSKNILIKILRWLPTILISIFFVLNAFDKIFNSNQIDKIVSNQFVMIVVGIILLISTVLFLWNKTIIVGAFILSIYMTCILLILIYKGKPYEAS